MPSKEAYWKDPEKHRAATNQYRLENPEWHRESNRQWAAKNRKENPEREKANQKRYREANSEARVRATREWAHKHPGVYLFHNAKARAKKHGVPFSITMADIVIPEFCPVLGIKIEASIRGRRGFHPASPSIDRIVPEFGYVPSNIMVISNLANRLKTNETAPDNLRKVADYIERETARIKAQGW